MDFILITLKHIYRIILLIAANILFVVNAWAFNNPTKGKPFLPWLWNDQIQPTIKKSIDKTGITIIGLGTVATLFSHQYDDEVHDEIRDDPERFMSEDSTDFFSALGAGPLLITVALGQTIVDRENGLIHARAIAFTSLTHLTLNSAVQRERPDKSNDYFSFCSSFPSGHVAHVFASASSLNYAYGWKVGIPSFTAATAVAVARINENKHWFSDVVAGAAIGLFWANASHNVKNSTKSKSQSMFLPIPYKRGGMMAYIRKF